MQKGESGRSTYGKDNRRDARNKCLYVELRAHETVVDRRLCQTNKGIDGKRSNYMNAWAQQAQLSVTCSPRHLAKPRPFGGCLLAENGSSRARTRRKYAARVGSPQITSRRCRKGPQRRRGRADACATPLFQGESRCATHFQGICNTLLFEGNHDTKYLSKGNHDAHYLLEGSHDVQFLFEGNHEVQYLSHAEPRCATLFRRERRCAIRFKANHYVQYLFKGNQYVQHLSKGNHECAILFQGKSRCSGNNVPPKRGMTIGQISK